MDLLAAGAYSALPEDSSVSTTTGSSSSAVTEASSAPSSTTTTTELSSSSSQAQSSSAITIPSLPFTVSVTRSDCFQSNEKATWTSANYTMEVIRLK